MLTVLKMAARALRQWRALPPEQRAQHRQEAARVRGLAIELGGPQARRLIGSDDGLDAVSSQPRPERSRSEIARELQEAAGALAEAAGRQAASTAMDSSRSLRVGGRLVNAGVRAGRRQAERAALANPSKSYSDDPTPGEPG